MAVKTITIKTEAYHALKALKASRESFSDTILRVAKRKPLSAFFGVLSEESATRLEKTIAELRKKRTESHLARVRKITEELNGMS